jgi:hypothetical protein
MNCQLAEKCKGKKAQRRQALENPLHGGVWGGLLIYIKIISNNINMISQEDYRKI